MVSLLPTCPSLRMPVSGPAPTGWSNWHHFQGDGQLHLGLLPALRGADGGSVGRAPQPPRREAAPMAPGGHQQAQISIVNNVSMCYSRS